MSSNSFREDKDSHPFLMATKDLPYSNKTSSTKGSSLGFGGGGGSAQQYNQAGGGGGGGGGGGDDSGVQHLQLPAGSGGSSSGDDLAGKIVLGTLVVIYIFGLLSLPLPVMNYQGFSHTMFDHNHLCDTGVSHLRTAGALSFISLFVSTLALVAILFEYAGIPIGICPFIKSKSSGRILVLLQWLFLLVPWAIMAHAYNSEICGFPAPWMSDSGSLSGGGFLFQLFAWLLNMLVVIPVSEWRRCCTDRGPFLHIALLNKLTGTCAYRNLEEPLAGTDELEGAGANSILQNKWKKTAGVGLPSDSVVRPDKGRVYYLECFIFIGLVAVFSVLVFSLPLEVIGTEAEGLSMFSDAFCTTTKNHLRASGAMTYCAIFASMACIVSFVRDSVSEPIHRFATPALLGVQNLLIMLAWAIVSGAYHGSNCGVPLKLIPGAGFQAAFFLLILIWLFHFAVVAAFLVRRFKEGGGEEVTLATVFIARMQRRNAEARELEDSQEA